MTVEAIMMTTAAILMRIGSLRVPRGVADRGGGARHRPAENAAQQDSRVAAKVLVADVTGQAQPDDQHDHQPDFVRVEHVESRHRLAKLEKLEKAVGAVAFVSATPAR